VVCEEKHRERVKLATAMSSRATLNMPILPSSYWLHKASVGFMCVGSTALGLLMMSSLVVSAPKQSSTPVQVTTYHNGNGRTGLNSNETILTPVNVNSATFGKLFSQSEDGYVYAQPLYLAGVNFGPQGIHNVVYVVTEHDSVYAFDADDNIGPNAQPLWQTSFINPSAGITTVPSSDVSCSDIQPEIGITGTPVINPTSGTLYLVARTKENGKYFQRLHALDITSGQEKFGGPVVISASVPGTGTGSSGGVVRFNPMIQNQRAGLLLQGGLVYVAWGSHCDRGAFHGWLMAFGAGSLRRVAAWNATPNQKEAGIWQAGGGLAGDSSDNIYLVTGNGIFDANVSGADYGDTVVKLAPPQAGVFSVADYFTPANAQYLSSTGKDLGSGGALLVPTQSANAPTQHWLIAGGKQGTIYLIDRDNMGKFGTTNTQSLTGAVGPIFSSPAWWNNTLYYGGSSDALKAFSFDPTTGLLSSSPVSRSTNLFRYSGVTPSISANGVTNAIVWVVDVGAWSTGGLAVLRAYNATDLSQELYDSNQNLVRDNPGPAVKFSVPTIANGKVYVPAVGQLSVYGPVP
jgi:hypothetical protein